MSTMTVNIKGSKKTTASQREHTPQTVQRFAGPASADAIRTRAYEIYESRNGKGIAGDATTDWLQAERELNGAAPRSNSSKAVDVRSQARGETLLASGE